MGAMKNLSPAYGLYRGMKDGEAPKQFAGGMWNAPMNWDMTKGDKKKDPAVKPLPRPTIAGGFASGG